MFIFYTNGKNPEDDNEINANMRYDDDVICKSKGAST